MRALMIFAALIATPAAAQEAEDEVFGPPPLEGESDVFDGDYAIIGVGAASVPDYEGADENNITPAAGAIGRVGGVGFRLRGPSLTTDFYNDPPGSRVTFRIGPTLRYRTNRSGKLDDDVVARLGKLRKVFDAGVGGGIGIRRVLTKQDSLSFGVGTRWDVSGRGSGYTVSTGASYLLPVSRAQVVGMAISGEWVSGKFARYNYNVSPAGSIASGLPVFTAKGGFNEASIGAFTALDLNGNILDGGFSVGVGALYTRLYGSAARTPITSIRGDRDQWLLGAGVGYAF